MENKTYYVICERGVAEKKAYVMLETTDFEKAKQGAADQVGDYETNNVAYVVLKDEWEQGIKRPLDTV